jgi:hypothetical protein
MPYRRAEVLRDITYLYHQCAAYRTIYGDNDDGTLLTGLYSEFFGFGAPLEGGEDAIELRQRAPRVSGDPDEDRFIRIGAVLLFAAMLVDWIDGGGFAFATVRGVCRHPLPTYVRYLLRSFSNMRAVDDPIEHHAVAGTLALCAWLDARKTSGWADYLYPELVQELRAVIRAHHLDPGPDGVNAVLADLYDQHVLAYFKELGGSP